jgi:diacylglycerol kinase family enzyme
MLAVAISRWMAERPALLVANPSAQSGRAAQGIDRARALLDEHGVLHRFLPTEPGGATIGLVRDDIDEQGTRVVIYMGGDGTFAEVAKGVLSSQHAAEVAMGMLPMGTANDQGKSFALEAGADALPHNVQVIAAGETLAIDVGAIVVMRSGTTVSRDLFFDSFSVGFGAAALVTRNRDRERIGKIPGLSWLYRDHAVYVGAVVQKLLESYVSDVKFDVEAIVDDHAHQFRSVLDIIVKNTRIFGGEWVLDPNIEADDGIFELIPIAGRRDLTRKLVGTHRYSPVTLDDLRNSGFEVAEPVPGARFSLRVRGEGELPVAQIDGEVLAAGDQYEIAVLARSLHLIVPRNHIA